MKKPSLKEVKKHFKNAEKFESALRGGEYKMDDFDFDSIFEDEGCFYINPKNEDIGNKSLWDDGKGYAKILSYREPTFKITQSQLEQLQTGSTTEKLEKWFPEVFVPIRKITKEQAEKELNCKIID